MASDHIDTASSEREIQRAFHEPTNDLWTEQMVTNDDNDSDLDDSELDRLQMEGKSTNTIKQTDHTITLTPVGH